MSSTFIKPNIWSKFHRQSLNVTIIELTVHKEHEEFNSYCSSIKRIGEKFSIKQYKVIFIESQAPEVETKSRVWSPQSESFVIVAQVSVIKRMCLRLQSESQKSACSMHWAVTVNSCVPLIHFVWTITERAFVCFVGVCSACGTNDWAISNFNC